MKAGLPQKEPAILKSWTDKDLYGKIRQWSHGRKRFVLGDGPPYANGDIHLGHAINKVLKDMVIKSKTLSGFDAPYVPGWDCHGLPIEHKVEQKIGKAGVKVDKKTFRKKCRDYAIKQVEGQKKDFIRLGILGEWDNPYLSMSFAYEANIVRSLAKIISNGHLQRGFKPVYWSVVGQSALAEAEVEYQDKTSTSIYVGYPVKDKATFCQSFALAKEPNCDISVVIWTTTPWTLPSSQAVSLGAELTYVLIQCNTSKGEQCFVLAEDLSETVTEKLGWSDVKVLGRTSGQSLENLQVYHPFYQKILPLILGEHVTIDSGTGCVHTSPDHGLDDFNTGKKYGLGTLNLLNDAGVFADNVEYVAGEHVYKVDLKIVNLVNEKGNLLYEEKITHSYPHCWRTKTPLIFRATPQWFISMKQNHLLKLCKQSLKDITFTPAWGKKRLELMLNGSPDWCISRQRTWGVPITLFVHKDTFKLHPDNENLMAKVAQRIEKSGIDSWFDLEPSELLSSEDAEHYIKITDTLDVWFDSGVSHEAVIKSRNLGYPADLYLEGSDQHRGWFQSSLKTGLAMNNSAPYKHLLTHGFTVDEHGHKMSKSLGNTISPKEITNGLGGDILRLWVSSVDYSTDMAVSKEIFKRTAEAYRRIRNTARFLLANLNGFDPEKDCISPDNMLPLDRWVVDRALHLQQDICEAYDTYSFSTIYHKLHNFCINDLGGFYLDVIKDRQYTTQKDSLARRSCQTALYYIAEAFVRWISPILSFTAEEIWQVMPGDRSESVHLSLWYDQLIPLSDKIFDNDFWTQVLAVREQTNKALEKERKAGTIGSALEASVTLYVDDSLHEILSKLDKELRFILITSEAILKPLSSADSESYDTDLTSLKLTVTPSTNKKCVRCWHRREDVGLNSAHTELCGRCIENVDGDGEKRLFA